MEEDDRPDRDVMLMAVAQVFARRSTCSRRHVGAVLSIDGRPISAGYNGAPAGMPHCKHQPGGEIHSLVIEGRETLDPVRVERGCVEAVHAEANAIAYAARAGVATMGATLHTTMAPCVPCAQLIINAGVVRVVWGQPYRDMSGARLLNLAGVEVV